MQVGITNISCLDARGIRFGHLSGIGRHFCLVERGGFFGQIVVWGSKTLSLRIQMKTLLTVSAVT